MLAGVVRTQYSTFVQHLHERGHLHRVVGVGLGPVNDAAAVATLGLVDHVRMPGFVNVLSGRRARARRRPLAHNRNRVKKCVFSTERQHTTSSDPLQSERVFNDRIWKEQRVANVFKESIKGFWYEGTRCIWTNSITDDKNLL